MRLSNNPYSSIKLGEAAFLITALPSIFLGILALRTICSWIGAYRFVSYLDSRFWPIFIAVTTIFFFYYYFRLVWDSLRQANPPADLRAFLAQEHARLDGTGWVDQAHGIAHIPIDDAMRRIAHDGIPDWPTK